VYHGHLPVRKCLGFPISFPSMEVTDFCESLGGTALLFFVLCLKFLSRGEILTLN